MMQVTLYHCFVLPFSSNIALLHEYIISLFLFSIIINDDKTNVACVLPYMENSKLLFALLKNELKEIHILGESYSK